VAYMAGSEPIEKEEAAGSEGRNGRKKPVTVMATGVFDILHLGHVHYLQEARKLGDRLVVVVANDATVRKFKHEPITPQEMRLELIKALRMVDDAHIGYDGDTYRIVRELDPDIIALGYDQHHDPRIIGRKTRAMGLKARVVRLPKFDHDLNGTRKIINKIIKERCAPSGPGGSSGSGWPVRGDRGNQGPGKEEGPEGERQGVWESGENGEDGRRGGEPGRKGREAEG